MGFFTAEFIFSYHEVTALSDRVRAADFDGSHTRNKMPSYYERSLLRH